MDHVDWSNKTVWLNCARKRLFQWLEVQEIFHRQPHWQHLLSNIWLPLNTLMLSGQPKHIRVPPNADCRSVPPTWRPCAWSLDKSYWSKSVHTILGKSWLLTTKHSLIPPLVCIFNNLMERGVGTIECLSFLSRVVLFRWILVQRRMLGWKTSCLLLHQSNFRLSG